VATTLSTWCLALLAIAAEAVLQLCTFVGAFAKAGHCCIKDFCESYTSYMVPSARISIRARCL
jgi:hypothetical protein